MSILLASEAITITDKLAAMSNAAIGTAGSGLGLGDATITPDSSAYGADRKSRDLLGIVTALTDYQHLHALLEQANTLKVAMNYQADLPGKINGFHAAMSAFAVSAGLAGVNSFDTFMLYYNNGVGGIATALLCPDYRLVYFLALNAYPNPLNVYSLPLATMATKTQAGVFTAGTNVDTTKYAGAGLAQVTYSGFTGASGLITVSGTNQLGQVGRTFTATVAANGTVTLVPGVATDLLVSVQSVTIAGTITGGTAIISAVAPAGRAYPPT